MELFSNPPEIDHLLAVQACVNRQNSRGLKTQPCGEPVLPVMALDVWLPTLSVSCRFVKSPEPTYQCQFPPSVNSAFPPAAVEWWFWRLSWSLQRGHWHKCSSAPDETGKDVSSTDRLICYLSTIELVSSISGLEWVQICGEEILYMLHNSCSKHFIVIGVRATGWKSFRQAGFVWFGTGTIPDCSRQRSLPASARR